MAALPQRARVAELAVCGYYSVNFTNWARTLHPSHDAVWLSFLLSLLGSGAPFGAAAHLRVGMTVFQRSDRLRSVLAFVNQAGVAPNLPIPAFDFNIRPPFGRRLLG